VSGKRLSDVASRVSAPTARYYSNRKYLVHAIVDRSACRSLYRVIWKGKHETQDRTWEPKVRLMRDGFGAHMDLVDQWVTQEEAKSDDVLREPFAVFRARVQPLFFTASDDRMCGFAALKNAVAVIGHPNIVTATSIGNFVTLNAKTGKDLTQGVKFPVLCAFVRTMVPGLSYIDFKKNRQCGGARRVGAVLSLGLEDGTYVVGASTEARVGHCFVLTVVDGVHMVIEDQVKTCITVYGEWIEQLLFVSKVVIQNRV
jgi:hypothetical protein